MADSKLDETYKEFNELVNMTASSLQKWLDSDDSKSVGIKKTTSTDKKTSSGGTESTGHEMGGKIVAVLGKKKTELNDEDEGTMRKVNGYIKRHLKQKPSGDIKDTRWRYSLMNWGHDPLKD